MKENLFYLYQSNCNLCRMPSHTKHYYGCYLVLRSRASRQ